jgi:hypothetical protein
MFIYVVGPEIALPFGYKKTEWQGLLYGRKVISLQWPRLL